MSASDLTNPAAIEPAPFQKDARLALPESQLLSQPPVINPRLLIISGPLGGTIVPVGEKVSIGRGADSLLRIKQPSVSRLHCLIARDGERFKITDLSTYGTFINDIPVKEHFLEHGDQIKINDNLLLFLLYEVKTQSVSGSVKLDDGDLTTHSAIHLQEENALYLDPERTLRDLRAPARVVQDLHTLLKISAVVGSLRNLESLQEELLKSILEIVPAERGAIILLRDGLEDFTSAVSIERSQGSGQPLRVSRTVAQQVLEERIAVLSNDVSGLETYRESESLLVAQTKSLLCVPLTHGERVRGLIYLVSGKCDVAFDERHLEMVTAIASVASVAIENARYIEWLKDERQRLQDEISLKHSMIGDSLKMRQVLEVISKVSQTDASALIRGESGTGKELVAQAIHANSKRSEKAFIAINCAALTEPLLESELFGHEKGAFTGAIAQKKGKLEIADGGTLFLDEIGELNPSLQAKILRVLQERTFERVGGTRSIKVDIRLLSATNRNLQEAIAEGVFREDLYYRLNVIEIEMPPLRERRADIPLLARYFVAKYSNKCKRHVDGLSPEAGACLMSHDWPGNVRELENAIERAVVLGLSRVITPEDLPETVRKQSSPGGDDTVTGFYQTLKETKKQLVLNALRQTNGNHAEAAQLLGIHPNNLHRLVRTLDLKNESPL